MREKPSKGQKHFCRPGVTKDVAEYCCSCEVCQGMARRGLKALLIPMPIIGIPFKQIVVDVIKPLLKSLTGEQYVLVITDYATRYPKAYAMRSVTASAVAERLIDMFCTNMVY